MRLFNLVGRKPVRRACISLVVIALCIASPGLSRTVQSILAERALRAQDAEAALGWLNSIPKWNRVGETHLLYARAHRKQGKFDLVGAHLRTAWEHGVQVELLEREQWLTQARAGQMDEAEPHLRQLLQDPRDDGQEICECYVTGYLLNYQFSRAAPILAAWEAEFPLDPRPHELKGAWLQDSERWSEAVASYEKALELAPGKTRIRSEMAVCLSELHDYDKAKLQFLRCLDETPNDSQLLIQWGEWLLSNGKANDTKAVLQRVLDMDPGNQDARFAMAKTLLMDGAARDAVLTLQQLHQENPCSSAIQYSLASALQASGMTEQAAEMYQQVNAAEEKLRHKQELLDSLSQNSNQPEVRYEIAMISMTHESPVEGLRWLLSVVDLDPRHAAAHAALADYYHGIGKLELEEKHRQLAETFGENQSE